MNSFMNEDVMWERLKDIQREGEIAGIEEGRALATTLEAAKRLALRAWLLAGLAARRAPRRHPAA